jgi:hypothetical protein
MSDQQLIDFIGNELEDASDGANDYVAIAAEELLRRFKSRQNQPGAGQPGAGQPERPTSNIEHPTLNEEGSSPLGVGRSTLSVQCSSSSAQERTPS